MVLLQYLCDFTKWQTPLHCREDSLHAFFYKQPSCYGSNVKNGLKVKQLAKQPSTLKKFGWTLNFTFSILSLLKLNFSTTVFGAT